MIIENIKKNKSYLIIIIIILLIVAVFVTKQIVVNNNVNNSVNNNSITTAKTYKVYNFGSALCPACIKMDPIYEKIKEEYKSVMNFEYVDVDKNIKLATTYEIEYTPTFIIVDETGKKVDKLIGYVPEDEFRKFASKWGNK